MVLSSAQLLLPMSIESHATSVRQYSGEINLIRDCERIAMSKEVAVTFRLGRSNPCSFGLLLSFCSCVILRAFTWPLIVEVDDLWLLHGDISCCSAAWTVHQHS